MTKAISVVVFLFLTLSAFAQQGEVECGWYGKKTPAQLKMMTPFDKAVKVQLISYPQFIDMADEIGSVDLSDSLACTKAGFKILRDFDVTHLRKTPRKYSAIEIAELNSDETSELNNLFFNFIIKSESELITISPVGCYTPRNAILFFDTDDKIISCLEVCFECGQSYLFPDPYNYNDLTLVWGQCYERMNILFEIFKRKGVKFGVKKL